MALAIDLYEYAYRYRKDCFNDFRIYLRVNGSCNTIQLKQIKEYFNIYGNTRDVIITFERRKKYSRTMWYRQMCLKYWQRNFIMHIRKL